MLPFFRSRSKDAAQPVGAASAASSGVAPPARPAAAIVPPEPAPPVLHAELLPSSSPLPEGGENPDGLSPENRRRATRYPCQFVAEMDILFPEETFRPRAYRVTILDVSTLGARMFLEEIDPHHLRLLMSGLRYCRLNLRDGQERRTIYGRLVWVGQHNSRGTQLGLAFDDRDKNVDESRRLLLDLARRNPPPGVMAT